jgi:peptidoglycan hydrolase-like protein with peptidoglycan-binding domain
VSAYWIVGAAKIECNTEAVSAFRALGRVLRRWNYHVRSDVTGCYNCRAITGGTSSSAHAYGLAIDINWDTNPYRLDQVITDFSAGMISDIQSIVTNDGVAAFRWGGDWDGRPDTKQSNYDAMHVEVIATRAELRAGFDVPRPIVAEHSTWPLLDIGERGPAVELVQRLIEIKPDGRFGQKTAAGVRAYQASRGIPIDGVVGLGTWTALLTVMSPIGIAGASPTKGWGRITQ